MMSGSDSPVAVHELVVTVVPSYLSGVSTPLTIRRNCPAEVVKLVEKKKVDMEYDKDSINGSVFEGSMATFDWVLSALEQKMEAT